VATLIADSAIDATSVFVRPALEFLASLELADPVVLAFFATALAFACTAATIRAALLVVAVRDADQGRR